MGGSRIALAASGSLAPADVIGQWQDSVVVVVVVGSSSLFVVRGRKQSFGLNRRILGMARRRCGSVVARRAPYLAALAVDAGLAALSASGAGRLGAAALCLVGEAGIAG